MPETPRISAIIPVYNGRKYLREAVDSVIAQTLPPIELIIVDDGSTDGSMDVLEGLEAPFPIVRLRQENAGQSAARNHGARVAKGDFIALLDQDDAWYPEHLEELARPFGEERRLGWAYSNLDEMDEGGGMVTVGMLDDLPAQHPKRSLHEMLSHDLFILPSASLIERKAFLAVGGFDERLSGYEDDDLFLRMFRAGYRNVYLPQSLSKWRIYGGSTSYTPRMAKSRRIYAEKLMEAFPKNPIMARNWIRDCIAPRFLGHSLGRYMQALEKGNDAECRAALGESLAYWRRMPHSRKLAMKLLIMRNPRVYRATRAMLKVLPFSLRKRMFG